MTQKIRVISCGIGALGTEIVQVLHGKPLSDIEIVAAADPSQAVAGNDLGRVAGLGVDLGVVVSDNPEQVLRTVAADIVLYAAEAYFAEMYKTVRVAVESGKNVISSGDEACYPWAKSPELADDLDRLAKEKRVTFVGTGVNPGFMMDYLPISLTAVMKWVDHISIRRVADTTSCGLDYWNKSGYGRSLEEFNRALAHGSVAGPLHMKEEAEMTARALGWKLTTYTEEKKALLSTTRREALSGVVEPGTVSGVELTARGIKDCREVITYTYDIIIDPSQDDLEVGNFISIASEGGTLECSVKGGLAKESWSRTAAIMANSIPRVIEARPGLLSVYELPPSPCLA